MAKSTTTPSNKADEFSLDAYEDIKRQLQALEGKRFLALFGDYAKRLIDVSQITKQLIEAAGGPQKAYPKILLQAVTRAGKKGLLLNEARRYVPDPTDLADAREQLLHPKDEDGNELEPLIKEKRVKNNELLLFLIDTEEGEEEAGEGEGEE